MGFSLLLFFQSPLLTSDLLTDQEVTRSKEVTLSGGNELAVLVGSSPVSLRVVAFEEVSWICRPYKNEVASRIKAICRIMWQVTCPRHYILKILVPEVLIQELLALGILKVLIKIFYWHNQVYQIVKVLKILIEIFVLRLLILKILISEIFILAKVLWLGIYLLLEVIVLKMHVLMILMLGISIPKVLVSLNI